LTIVAEFVVYLLSAIADYWGQAGQRRAWWMLGAILIVVAVVWAVFVKRAA